MPSPTRSFGVDWGARDEYLTPGDEFVNYIDNMSVQNCTENTSVQVDVTQDEDGEWIPDSKAEFGKRTDLSWTLKSNKNGSYSFPALTLENPGELDVMALDSVTINTAKGQKATVNIAGHIHDQSPSSNTIVGHDTRTRATTIPAFPGFGASAFGLSVGVAEASLQSGTYSLQFEHVDEQAADGNQLCGITHGVKHTVTLEAVEDTAWTVPQGWTEESDGHNQANTAYRRRTLTISKWEASPVDHSNG